VTVEVGINDPAKPTIAVLAYMPAKVTVEVGTPVVFDWKGTIEPHSVTFLAPGQTLPAPGSDPSLFAPTPAKGPIDGTTFVNSGLGPLGPTAMPPLEETFAKAGTYELHCVIHPVMVGTVEVVEKGASGVDTPAAAKSRGDEEKATLLAEGQKAAADFAKSTPASTKNADGTTTWQIEMGTSTEHTQIYAFQPTPAAVKAGDTVTFVNNSGAPHTASFFGKTAPIVDPTDPRTDAAAPGASPQTLDDSGFFNTGLLPPNAPPGAGPPEAVRSFSFVVPKAGTYAYVCILHVPSGMAGQVKAA
jgi:plastocyanin